MNKIKFIIPIIFLAFVLISAKSAKEDNNLGYSGEQLFRGIFFFQGNIPNQIAAFKPIKEKLDKLEPFKKIEEENFVNEIVSSVNGINHLYFNELKAAVESKDNYRIDETMKTGVKLIQISLLNSNHYKVLLKIPQNAFAKLDISKYDLTKESDLNLVISEMTKIMKNTSKKIDNSPNGTCVAVTVVVALAVWDVVALVNYAAVVNAAALAVVYAAVYASVVFWPKEAPATASNDAINLEREVIINSIANLKNSDSQQNNSFTNKLIQP